MSDWTHFFETLLAAYFGVWAYKLADLICDLFRDR